MGDMGERYYVYAIAAPDIRLPETVSGFGGPLHVIRYGELGAVASCVHATAVGDITRAASADDLLRHEAVVEAVRACGPALPVRFGAVLPGADDVSRALAAQHDTLVEDLRRIGDKIELGVTALWYPSGGHDGAPSPGPDAGRRGDADMADSADRPGLTYLRTRQTEYRQAESARERARALARELDAVLRPHALACHRSVCPSARLALRDVYLLEREQVDAFERAFAEVRQRHHHEVRCMLSGPWPPYSFVTPPARAGTEVLQGTQVSRPDRQSDY